jgi:hypothetical protein
VQAELGPGIPGDIRISDASLVYVNVLAMAQPEAYASQAGELVDEFFRITKEETREFFTTFLNAFEAWIEKTRTV